MELCHMCKTGYLKPTNDARKVICDFRGRSFLHLSLKDYVDSRGKPDSVHSVN